MKGVAMALTKYNIVDQVAEGLGCQKSKAIEAVESLLELIKTALGSGDDVLISGFGKFCIKAKKARLGRNPATGKQMMLDSRRVVTFRCSGGLKEKLNGED